MIYSDERIPEQGTYPPDCNWRTVLGGGSWFYLMRPNDRHDAKVYGAVRPENLGVAVQRTTNATRN